MRENKKVSGDVGMSGDEGSTGPLLPTSGNVLAAVASASPALWTRTAAVAITRRGPEWPEEWALETLY
jgi:hypothetical protein